MITLIQRMFKCSFKKSAIIASLLGLLSIPAGALAETVPAASARPAAGPVNIRATKAKAIAMASLSAVINSQVKRVQHLVLLAARSGSEKVKEIPVTPSPSGLVALTLPAGIYRMAWLAQGEVSRPMWAIYLRPGSPTHLGTIKLQKSVSVRLTVRDLKTHNPIANALVRWDPPTGFGSAAAAELFQIRWSGKASADGSAIISDVLSGIPLRWLVAAGGYITAESPQLRVPAGKSGITGDIFLAHGSHLAVTVVGDALPPGEWEIALASSEGKVTPIFRTEKIRKLVGRNAAFENVAPGLHRLLIEGDSRVLLTQDFTMPASDDQIVLYPRVTTISGTVRAGDAPVAGATVSIENVNDNSDNVFGKTTADDAGRYKIETFAKGLVRVGACAPSSTSEGGECGGPILSLGPETDNVTADVTLADGSIRVKVVDSESGDPIKGAHLYREVERHGRVAMVGNSSTTDADGKARFAGVKTGPAMIEVRARGYSAVTQDVTMGSSDQEVTVELTKSNAINGVVLDPLGEPVAGASILGGFFDPTLNWAPFSVTSDDTGHFEISSPPSTPTLFWAFAPGSALSSVVLMPGQDNTISLTFPSPVPVTVVSTAGPPLANFRVLAARHGYQFIPDTVLLDFAETNGMTEHELEATDINGRSPLSQYLGPDLYDFYVVLKVNGAFVNRLLGTVPLPLPGPDVLVCKM